jgi:diguanylate cyclase (GGDEF)-like protein
VHGRAVLLELLAHQLALAARLGHPVALIVVEPDEPPASSRQRAALRLALARRLAERVRADDLLGHWGEASFLIVLPGTDIGGALVLAQDLRDGLARNGIELDGRRLGASVGVHAHQPSGRGRRDELALTLAAAAQRALDATRADGPGRIEIEP